VSSEGVSVTASTPGASSDAGARRRWTLLGALAVPLWALWPALTYALAAIPVFQVLATFYFFGWLALALVDRFAPAVRPPASTLDRIAIVFCALGLCGSNICFLYATHSITAAQANLLSYLWPVMVVLGGGALRLFRLRPRDYVGLAVAFAGTISVIGGLDFGGSPRGAILGVLSGASWAAFCLFRQWQGPGARPVLMPACGLSALLCLGLHLGLETTVRPGPAALAALAVNGVFPLALGNVLWDLGFRRGNGQLLAVLAYGTPILGAALLIVLGLASPSVGLLVGAALIVIAGLLCRQP